MEAQFVLKFTPPDSSDYAYTIECVTERETFHVPIFAVGNRGTCFITLPLQPAIIDINDEMSFGRCPVNYESSKTLLLRNIGDAPAKFTLSTTSPFKLSPSSGFLNPNDALQVEITVNPLKTGSYVGELFLDYETGERVVSVLRVLAHEISLFLEKTEIKFTDQSIQQTCVQKIGIVNHSDFTVHYDWRKMKSTAEEDKLRQVKIDALKADHAARVRDEAGLDIVLATQHLNAKIKTCMSEVFVSDCDAFTITPASGVIWPHASVEASIMFSPVEFGLAESIQYCAISGLENRLALNMQVSTHIVTV